MKKKTDKSNKNAGWRHFTPEEKKKFRKAYVNTFGKVGRPALDSSVKKKSVHIKLDPDVIKKFKDKAQKTGKPYQTLINEALKKAA